MKRALLWPVLASLTACGPGGVDPTGEPTGPGDSATSSTGTPVGTTSPTGRMEASGPIACAAPSATAPAPYQAQAYGEGWPKNPDYRTPAWDLMLGGRGAVVHDFDLDGHLDLLVPREEFGARFLLGDGAGGFTPADDWFQGVDLLGHNGGSAGDIDGDGDPDAFFYGLMGSATLLVNEGDRFTVIDRSDLDTGDAPFGCGGSAAWADMDRDGDLDLFYGRLGGTDPFTGETFTCDSRMLLNDGDGSFTASDAQLAGPLQDTRIMVAGFYDMDDDGWLDLYAVSDAPPMRNYLLRNAEGTLSHAQGTGLEVITAGMGLGVGDLNGDEIPDAVISGIRELPALLSQPGLEIWAESSTAMELYPDEASGRTVAWGGDLADLDNDTHLDAVFTYGGVFGNGLPKAQPDDLYRNRGDGTFEHVGDAWGWNETDVGRGAISVDLNGDGWLDLVKRELGGVVTVSLASCGDAAWLTVRLQDELHPNTTAVGATVTVISQGRRLVRTVTAGSRSYCSGGPPQLHFGLGTAEAIEGIEVRWPTGELSTYAGTDTRQHLTLFR